MSARPHVVVIHRWRARYAEYERYLDHERYAVSYITTTVGVDGVPAAAAEVALVEATDDLAAVRRQVGLLAERHGAPHRIVALKEDDLLIAAQLTVDWGCPGRRPEDLTVFRDKLVMARAVADAGLAAPAFAAAPSAEAVRAFAAAHGWPVVLKPRLGSSSEGVVKINAPDELDALAIGPDARYLVQSFSPDHIYHVDGVFDGRALGPWGAYRYMTTCLGFRAGQMLACVQEDDPRINAAIGAFTGQVLSALSDRSLVFHLEIFVRDAGPAGPTCSFLEIGARVGGGEIPFLWREVHGYDLMEAAFQIALGLPPCPAALSPDGDIGGWLLAPAPAARPCRILDVTSMAGRVPGPYAEALPRPGEILPAADAYYEHVGGRFRFRGPTTAAVEAAILATARDFRARAEPCEQPPRPRPAGPSSMRPPVPAMVA